MVDLKIELGTRAVESILLYHKYAADGVLKLMDMSLSRFSQLEAGRAEPLLQRPDIKLQ